MNANKQPATRRGIGGAVGAFFAAFFGDLSVLLFAAVAVIASFRGEPADAYHFPQLTSLLLLLFATVNIGKNIVRPIAPPLSPALCRRLLPGIVIAVVYIYICDIIGFYWSATAAFVLLAACYRPTPRHRKQWLWLGIATATVMGGVYLLFGIILQVQTPDPFWID